MFYEPVLIFDFGNTLAPFTSGEDRGIEDDLTAFVCDSYPAERSQFRRLWEEARAEDARHSEKTGEEHDFSGRLKRVISKCGFPVNERFIREAEKEAVCSFVRRVRVDPQVGGLLRGLSSRYRLALFSNYLLSEPVHTVLKRDSVHHLFDPVVVSREIGFAKPHPRAFNTVLKLIRGKPSQAVYVGDNLEADVRGAMRCGLKPVWTWAMLEEVPVTDTQEKNICVLKNRNQYLDFLRSPEKWLSTPNKS